MFAKFKPLFFSKFLSHYGHQGQGFLPFLCFSTCFNGFIANHQVPQVQALDQVSITHQTNCFLCFLWVILCVILWVILWVILLVIPNAFPNNGLSAVADFHLS